MSDAYYCGPADVCGTCGFPYHCTTHTADAPCPGHSEIAAIHVTNSQELKQRAAEVRRQARWGMALAVLASVMALTSTAVAWWAVAQQEADLEHVELDK